MDPRRAVRRDLSSVSDAEAERVLARCKRSIEMEVYRFARRITRIPTIDVEDLRILAQIAVLEAYVLFRDDRGALFHSWAQRIMRWRLDEAINKEATFPGPGVERLRNGRTPYELFEEMEERTWAHQAIGALSPRQRTILAAKINGESLSDIAPTLGIGRSRVYQEVKAAVCSLRKRASVHGLLDDSDE